MNHFDTTFAANENKLRQLIADETKGHNVNADNVLAELAKWVGWYRMETENATLSKTPREQHIEADEILETIAKLDAQLAGISPNFRAHLLAKMRHLGEPMPNLTRLRACLIAGKDELAKPRNGEQPSTKPRNNAIRMVSRSILAEAPGIKEAKAEALAADLVRDALKIKVPTDAKDLRNIARDR